MVRAPRRYVALAIALVLDAVTTPPVGAAEVDVAKAEAAVRDAQRQATAANRGLQGAEAALDNAENDVVTGAAELAAARARLEVASAAVRSSAIREYTGGRARASFASDDIAQITRGRAYLNVATGASTNQVDQLRAGASDLEAREKALARRLRTQREKLAAFQRLESQLASGLDRLGNELEAARRREAEAKAAAAVAQEADRARLEAQASTAEDARKRLESVRNQEARSARPPAATAAPVNRGPWVCPVQGGATFTNDWGFPRSGGRRHQGNDLFAPRGTPVVASVAGTYRRSSSGLGGITYYLKGSDGNTYYGAHMAGYGSVGPGPVAQGAVLGFVGNSGNARGTSPHLHFEIQPGGGGAVNPFPTVSRAC